MIKMTYNETSDIVYITLGEDNPKEFRSVCTSSTLHHQILLDFDKDKKLVGIEVIAASTNLKPELIEYLKKIENMRKESHSYLSPGC